MNCRYMLHKLKNILNEIMYRLILSKRYEQFFTKTCINHMYPINIRKIVTMMFSQK